MVSQLYLSSPLHSNDGDFQSKSKHTNIIVTLIEIHFNPACEKNALYIKKWFHFLHALFRWKTIFVSSNGFSSAKSRSETEITFLYPTGFKKPELLFYIPHASRNQNYFLYPRGLTKLKSLFVFRWVAKNLRCCRLFPTLSGWTSVVYF